MGNNNINRPKKILTLEDLVKFCENNQFNKFSAEETGYQLSVHVPATFEKTEKSNDDSILYCLLKVCHTNLNRNNSYISEESMNAALPTLKYKPILCNFKDVEENGETVKDFTSHDMDIDNEGNITYIERQVGCFTADEPYLQYDKEMDKTYVMAYAAIPFDYSDAADIILRKNGTKVSCELSINSMSYNTKEHYLQLEDFIFTGCTLLGEDIGEGMLGSRLDIADFSQQNNSLFSSINEEDKAKLIEMQNTINSMVERFNINNKAENADKDSKEGGNVIVENEEIKVVEEVAETEEIEYTVADEVAEDVVVDEVEVTETESTEEVTETETENESEETVEETPDVTKDAAEEFEEDVVDESTDEVVTDESEGDAESESNEDIEETIEDTSDEVSEDEVADNEVVSEDENAGKYSITITDCSNRNFELSLDEIQYALYTLVNDTYAESDNTWYSISVYDSYIIMHDYWNGRNYKQSYKRNEDNFSLVGDRVEVYANWLTKEEEADLADLRANYEVIKDKLSAYEDAEIKADKMEVFDEYAEYFETDEFKTLMKDENVDKFSKEELSEKAEAAFGRIMKKNSLSFSINTTASASKKKNKVGINANFEKAEDNEPYGDYFKSLEY